MSILIIFLSQFLCVFLLGVQSLMVRDSNLYGAAIGSLMIGISQFYIFSIIGSLGVDDIGGMKWVAFIFAGPVAIVISIKAHPLIIKLFARNKN